MPDDASPSWDALNVLLLEDVDTDAELIRHQLRADGITGPVQRVDNKADFEAALDDSPPDIVLADYSLPAFDGLTALRMVQERYPTVPVVFVSGAIGEERAIETLKQGATDYVLKDMLSRLGPAVKRALREAEERRARQEAEAALRQAHDALEQTVKERTAALRESQQRLSTIVDSAIDAIINIEADRTITLFNPAAESIFACSAADACGQPLTRFLTDEFDALLADYLQQDVDAEGRYLAASEGIQARRASGDTFPVEATISPLPLPNGATQHLLILRDIDARTQAEAAVSQLASEKQYLQEEIRSEKGFETIVGTSPLMHEVFTAIDQVASTDTTVLVCGQTGTGKELVARAVHERSPRADNVLVKVNCSALAPDLIESELFGHEKGAFTGASEQRVGRFELADEGTLFLDEIGELAMSTQSKLLRALQEQEFERVGGSRTIQVDTRIIAATNVDLEQAVEEGRFRSDLYFRLNIFPINLPPLRDRRSDIPLLVEHFRTLFAQRMGKSIEGVSPSAMAVLKAYDWPGNVRELANIMERAVILAQDGLIRADNLSITQQHATNHTNADELPTLQQAQRQHIIRALEATEGTVGGPDGAAALLDIKRTTLLSRMDRLGIDADAYRG
jgi:PAS domain S-box-containing protein